METLARPTATDEIDVRNPENGDLVARVPSASLADLDAALARAEHGARVARSMSTHERMLVLRTGADAVESELEELARTIALEGIKTIREARAEVRRAAETLRLSSEEARRLTGETIAFDQRPGSEGRVGYWVREPVGVVAAITPFNDPLNLVAHKVGPAIAAGNAVVVKPHSATPLSALKLARILARAGLHPDVVQVVTGRGAIIGESLVSDPRVAMVSFTGGPSIGDRLLRAAGRKRVTLELGANSPNIVLNDADIPAAARAIVAGAFAAAGQNCLHVQRVIVEREVARDLTDLILEGTAAIRQGPKLDPATDMGPIISDEAATGVLGFVGDAVRKGAHLLGGGHCAGTAFEPTIIGDLPANARLATEEVFGPVTGITAVASADEAVRLANSADQALHAAVFTRDLALAMRMTKEVEAGAVIVNDSSDYRLDAMPFGGVKNSGLGREGVAYAIEEMTTTKVVCLNV